MDRVRLGRALGYGARHVAKALVQAADAATASDTERPAQATRPPASSSQTTTQVPVSATRTATTAARAKQASKSFLHPVKRYSGTVLLQVAGTFFAVFALLMAQAAWRFRAGFHQHWNSQDAQHLWLTVALLLVFGWFAVSSFLRANRLGRS